MTILGINFMAAAAAAVGLFFIAGSAGGFFTRMGGLNRFGGKRILLQDAVPGRAPFAARLAAVLSEAIPLRKSTDPVSLRLSRAGNPYGGVVEFYQRKFVMMVSLAAAGMTGCLLLGTAPGVTFGAAAVLGAAGFFAPDSEVRDALERRSSRLRREMAFMLDRVAFAVMAYGTFQEALARINQLEQDDENVRRSERGHDENPVQRGEVSWSSGRSSMMGNVLAGQNPSEPRSDTRQGRIRMVSFGSTVSGIGGGLFAEYLNRMASMLLGSAGVQFDSIREQLGIHYPPAPELRTFLDIVETGLRGTPMTERLLELTDSLILDLEQEQREAGMKATSVVILAAGAVLVPLLLVVGGPAFFLAISVFGG